MNSKRIGNVGEAAILSKMVEHGIPVYLPFGDNEKADLVADFNGRLVKIQIKTSLKAEQGSYSFNTCSSMTQHTVAAGSSAHFYTDIEVDYLCFYNIDRKVCLIVDIKDCPKRAISFRYEASLSGQVKGIKFEQDYLLDNFLQKL